MSDVLYTTRQLQYKGQNPSDYYRWKAFIRQFGEPNLKDGDYYYYFKDGIVKCFNKRNLKWYEVKNLDDGYVLYNNGKLYNLMEEECKKLEEAHIEYLLLGD